jgi:hypothetical protein
MSNNIIEFPTDKNTNNLSFPTYTYNVTVQFDGVELPEHIWKYGVEDAVRDIKKDQLKKELDDLYRRVKDYPEKWDFVIAAVNRIKSQY